MLEEQAQIAMASLVSLAALLLRRVLGRRPTRAVAALEIRRRIAGHPSGHRARSLDLSTPEAAHLGIVRRQQQVAQAGGIVVPAGETPRLLSSWPEIVAYDIGEQVVHGPTGLVMVGGRYVTQSGPANMPALKYFAADQFLSEWDSLVQLGAVPLRRLSGPVHHAGSFHGGNYYHWLIDTLPRILRARTFEPQATIVVPERRRFVEESLTELGIAAEFTSSSLRAERLVVLDHRRSDSPRSDDIEVLRMSVKPAAPTEDRRRAIYVSRSTDSRAMRGEAALEEWCQEQGILVLRGDRMPTWVDQVAAFRGADIIVGPHGAGLSNMIFCEPGAAIVELLPARCERPSCFEQLARSCGHRYFGLPVSTPGSHDGDAEVALRLIAPLLEGLR